MDHNYLLNLGNFILDLHGTKRVSFKIKGILVTVKDNQVLYNGKKDFPPVLDTATLDDFECSVSLKLKIEFFEKKRK